MLVLASLVVAAFILSNHRPCTGLCLGIRTRHRHFDHRLAALHATCESKASIMSADATIEHVSSAHEKNIAQHATSLVSRVIDAPMPTVEETMDILTALERDTITNKDECNMTIALLESTKIGKLLTKVLKTCKRHKRGSNESRWDEAIALSERLLSNYKRAADAEAAAAVATRTHHDDNESPSSQGLPPTVSAYRARLLAQKKELYKDPPVLPPPLIHIEQHRVTAPPQRNKARELSFVAGKHASPSSERALHVALRDFHPNLTPEEILRSGSFGGTYFRPIVSAVTDRRYSSAQALKESVLPEWIAGLSPNMLTSTTYDASINKHEVKCGGSLGMWESSGWISSADPYGWFQWYCRFYAGRRCEDDVRQIGRWRGVAGERGRFRSQLCNKILGAGGLERGAGVSPVVRQTLLHWGLEVTEEILERHKKRVGK